MKKQLEKEIQFAICEYLAAKKRCFWRQNTSAIINRETGNFRSMPKFSMNGVPDIVVILDGKFIGLEVKRKGNKQSSSQIEFERFCKEVGKGQYYVVESINDVQKIGL